MTRSGCPLAAAVRGHRPDRHGPHDLVVALIRLGDLVLNIGRQLHRIVAATCVGRAEASAPGLLPGRQSIDVEVAVLESRLGMEVQADREGARVGAPLVLDQVLSCELLPQDRGIWIEGDFRCDQVRLPAGARCVLRDNGIGRPLLRDRLIC